MTSFDSGDIALVRFPFTDLTTSKQRPAVIVSGAEYSRKYGDVIFVPLTSQPQSNSALALHNWKSAGLLRATWVKPILATINSRLIVKVIGTIQTQDRTVVKVAIKEALHQEWLTK